MNEKRGREERDESFENVQFEGNQANGIFNTTIDSDTDDYDNIRFKLSCNNNDNEMFAEYDTRKFVCRELHCHAEFSTMPEYEMHVHTSHRHQCSICGRSFSSDHLLSIHISEMHDSYFQVLAQRKPSYVCLVENCSAVFCSDADRKSHLVQFHLYPTWFDFHIPSTIN